MSSKFQDRSHEKPFDRAFARLTRSAAVVGAGALLSRCFGFARDMIIAWGFGAGLSADAFFLAFRIPNLFRKLFAEGSLSIAFISVFTGRLVLKGEKDAFALAGSVFLAFTAGIAAVAALGAALLPWLMPLIAPGYLDDPEKFDLTLRLTRLMLPYLVCIGAVSVSMGVLNALGHFAGPALTPVIFNICLIGAALWIAPRLETPVYGLAAGVLLGGVVQILFQAPFLRMKGVSFRYVGKQARADVKRVFRQMGPAAFGASGYQINIFIGALLATLLPEGGVSCLYYADRMVQFPLGLFAVAAATAALPDLSRRFSARQMTELAETFAQTLNLTFFIIVPAMIGLIVLRGPILSLLFQRGAFDAAAVARTADALLYYGAGLWAFAAVRITVSLFYAMQETGPPLAAALIAMAVNAGLGLALMGPMAHGGVALAASIAGVVNFLILVRALKSRLGAINLRRIADSACKTLINSAIMGVCVHQTWNMISMMINRYDMNSSLTTAGATSATIAVGVTVYGLLSYAFKRRELNMLTGIIKPKTDKA